MQLIKIGTSNNFPTSVSSNTSFLYAWVPHDGTHTSGGLCILLCGLCIRASCRRPCSQGGCSCLLSGVAGVLPRGAGGAADEAEGALLLPAVLQEVQPQPLSVQMGQVWAVTLVVVRLQTP